MIRILADLLVSGSVVTGAVSWYIRWVRRGRILSHDEYQRELRRQNEELDQQIKEIGGPT